MSELPPRHARRRAARPTITRARYAELARRVKLLSWISLAWMTVEGAVAIGAGITAGSIALVGFGLDSAIEGFASVIIVWRFTGQRMSRTPRNARTTACRGPVLRTRALCRLRIDRRTHRRRTPRGELGRHRAGDGLGDPHADPRYRQAAARRPARLSGDCRRGTPEHALRVPRRRAARRLARERAGGRVVARSGGRAADRRRSRQEGSDAWRGRGYCVGSPLDGDGFAEDGCDDDCCS